MKRINLALLLLIGMLILGSNLHAQVGINETSDDPDPSAMLEISSKDKGLLIPRMDSSSRKAIINPAEGLMVYDSTTQSFWYYQQQWQELGSGTISTIADADHDTKIQLEKTPDEDIIRMELKGAERIAIDSSDFYAQTNLFAKQVNAPSVRTVQYNMAGFQLAGPGNGVD